MNCKEPSLKLVALYVSDPKLLYFKTEEGEYLSINDSLKRCDVEKIEDAGGGMLTLEVGTELEGETRRISFIKSVSGYDKCCYTPYPGGPQICVLVPPGTPCPNGL